MLSTVCSIDIRFHTVDFIIIRSHCLTQKKEKKAKEESKKRWLVSICMNESGMSVCVVTLEGTVYIN
jgi:hypothetical protein